jgi:alanyl-tRNA synthetase
MNMSGDELRRSFLSFLEKRGHVVLPSASLVPENNPTVLFTTAGMHPLIPYLLGEVHPRGPLLANIQKCLRTNDLEEAGDASHLTFFEMAGFWSLDSYWKEVSLAQTLAWFTEELGLDLARLAVTVFAGDENAPRDESAAEIWRELGIPQKRIFYLSKEDNWWPDGAQNGPCGPDSEIFYDTLLPSCGPACQPGCHCGKYIEIANNVFMQYNKKPDGTLVPLIQRNIDVGIGLERVLCVVQGKASVYETDLFTPIMQATDDLLCRQPQDQRSLLTPHRKKRLKRIIADHLRAATFLLADGIRPSHVEQGYVCRRLLRRAMLCAHELALPTESLASVVEVILQRYGDAYPELEERRAFILDETQREERLFAHTLERGLREFQQVEQRLHQQQQTQLTGADIFRLFDTFGFPPTLTAELAQEHSLQADLAGFEQLFKEHQERSRQANQARFKGGLAEQSETATRLHTATHLLQQALRDVLGTHVHQMGSNITSARLRFDFSHPQKLTTAQIQQVEELVNQQIQRDLEVSMEIIPLEQALQHGALAFFGERYPDRVKVYAIGDYSLEVCGGPHVSRTGSLGRFQIVKTETIGQDVQRVRGTLV